jgi:hypothetical protein
VDELRRKRQEREAREFMLDLGNHPFVAVVMTPEGPVLYCKSADDKLREEAATLLQGAV